MKPERVNLVQTICLLIISGFVIAWALYFLSPVLIPLILAMFLAIALKPIVDVQVRKLKVPHKIAVVLTLLLGFVVLAAVGLVVIVSVQQAAGNASAYQQRLVGTLEWAADKLPDNYVDDSAMLLKGIADFSGPVLKKLVLEATNTVMSIMTTGFLVFVILCFLMFGTGGLTKAPPKTWVEIESQTRKYIVTKTSLSVATGILVGFTLWMLNVELALLFGLLTVILNFIPSIGSVIATLLPLPMVILNPDSTVMSVTLVFLIPLVIQSAIGNGLEPRIMGQNLKLHPITLILALIFWGMLWGFIGMFLAVPLTAVLRILLDKSDLTRPLADLFGGRISSEQYDPK